MSSSEVKSDSPVAENDVSVTGVPSLTTLPTPKVPSKFKTFYDILIQSHVIRYKSFQRRYIYLLEL